jgi:hypothetical protein
MPEIEPEYQVIRNLVIQIFLEKRKPLPEYLIHKILFKYKVNIKNKYPSIYNDLQFYWYKHGAYFEDVANTMSDLRSEGILSAEPFRHKYKKGFIYSLNTIKLGYHESILRPIELDDLRAVAVSVDETEGGEFNRELYSEYAPYEFQTLYNKTYLELYDALYYGDKPFSKNDISKLKSMLIDCEAELIHKSLFEEFNDVFASYCTIAYRVYNYYRGKGEDRYYFNELEYITHRIWDVFVDGLRIIAHTERFNDRLIGWEKVFNEEVNGLKGSLREVINNINKKFAVEGYPAVSRDKPKEILGVIIDNY